MRGFIACASLLACSLLVAPVSAAPIDGTFNYQGRLTVGGTPITGTADLRFTLRAAAVGGPQIGSSITVLGLPVTDGLFNADLDFGVFAFDGEQRWLQIEVRHPAGVGGYTPLGLRQKILGAPYAVQTRGIFVNDDLDVYIGTHANGRALHINNGGTNIGRLGASQVDGGGLLTLGTPSFSPLRTITLDSDLDDSDNAIAEGEITVRSLGGGDGGSFVAMNDSSVPTVVIRGGASGQAGSFTMHNYLGQPIIGLRDALGDGRLELVDPLTGLDYAYIGKDRSPGGGGILVIDRNDSGQPGFFVNGNEDGSGSTVVTINGTARNFRFDTTQSGSNSTQLPIDAVQDTEILDEPGVVSALQGSSSVALTGTPTIDTILSRTINCPTAGYCVVIGTGQAQAAHVNGTTSNAEFGVTDETGFLPVNQDVLLQYPSNAATGSYAAPVTVHGTFSVSSGDRTFSLAGKELSGSWLIYDTQLTVMFFPTRYGTVSPTLLARGGADNEAPVLPPMSATEIEAERLRSVADNQARRDAELAEVRAMMQALQSELDDLKNQIKPAPNISPPNRQGDDETSPVLGSDHTNSR